MTPAEFRSLRCYLGFAGEWISSHFDVNARTVRRWDSTGPIPDGVAEGMTALADMTTRFVEREAALLADGPQLFEIPRTVEDRDAMTPTNDLPLDWWRNAAQRVVERVPGTSIEWI